MEIILFISGLIIGGIGILFSVAKISKLEKQNQDLLIYKGRFSQAEITINDLKLQNQKQNNNLEIQHQKVINFEKQNELLKQSQNLLNQEKQEWTKDKEKILFQLSEELVRKNNEEHKKFGKNQEENIHKITQNLYKSFENVLNKVSSLDDDVKKSNQDINLTKNALLNPSGAGRAAEITLKNILKSSGLKEKTNIDDYGDYILQSHFFSANNIGKKPDALVFLPGDHIVIIDSKSSIFFLELQKAKEDKNQNLQEVSETKLKEAMYKHLEDLKKREYAEAKEFDSLKKNSKSNIFTTIMFLQTEEMLKTVQQIDKNFEQKALKYGIWVLTPIGVYNLLAQGKLTINRIKQQENIEDLRIELKKLIETISIMFNKANNIGKATSRAVKSYNEFASTFNHRFLVRINNLNKMGIESDKQITNNKLEKYHISNDENIIEGEVD